MSPPPLYGPFIITVVGKGKGGTIINKQTIVKQGKFRVGPLQVKTKSQKSSKPPNLDLSE